MSLLSADLPKEKLYKTGIEILFIPSIVFISFLNKLITFIAGKEI